MDAVLAGNGPICILAVHGIQGTRAVWNAVVQELDGLAHFVLPNLRGRGAALRGNSISDYSLERFADDLQEVIHTKIGARPFVLAGWSMGVSVSIAYLSRASNPRPQGLVLMSGTPALDRVSWFRSSGKALLGEVAIREARLGLREAADYDAVAWTWEAIKACSQNELLGDIDVPSLIIHGCEDTDSPWSHAELFAKGLSNARLCGLPGIGHSVLKDAPKRVAFELRAFLHQLSDRENS